MDLRKAIRASILAAVASALVYAAIGAFTDLSAARENLSSFPLSTLALMVGLTLTCYLVRALRWWYLMRVLHGPMRVRDAVYVQLSGMTMTVTPGKIGEVLKASLATELGGLPMPRTIAMVFSERVADVVAVLALSAGALGLLGSAVPALLASIALAGLGVAALASAKAHAVVRRVLLNQPWMKRHADLLDLASETIRTVMSPRPAAVSVALSLIAWSSEGVAFWVCARGLGFDALAPGAAVSIYAVSTIVGALTFAPGGIGLTEASLAGLLVAVGMGAPQASAATVLIRLVTLWFGVALGWVALATRPKLLARVLGAEDAATTSS